MKKLFISCPMKGRTEEAIKKSMDQLHKIAEVLAGEELEVIDTYLADAEYNDKPIKCLGESIKRMQDADYYISPGCIYDWRGCRIERDVAESYGVTVLDLSVYSMMPDAVKAIEETRIPTPTLYANCEPLDIPQNEQIRNKNNDYSEKVNS